MVRLVKTRQDPSDANGDLSERLVTVLDLTSAAPEAYRTLRINLLYALVDLPLKVKVVNCPDAQKSKNTNCANLAVVLLVVDYQNSRKGFLQQAVHNLEKVSANKRNTVVNNIEIQKSSHYKYDPKYRSKSGTEEGSLQTTRRASGEMR